MSVRMEKLGRPVELELARAADGATPRMEQRSAEGCRVTMIGSGGLTAATAQVQGSFDGTNWYNLGVPVVFTADQTRTVWVGEPNTLVRVDYTGVVGGVLDTYVQMLD